MENQIESLRKSCSARGFPRSPAMPFGWPLPRGDSLPGTRTYLARTVRIQQTPTVLRSEREGGTSCTS